MSIYETFVEASKLRSKMLEDGVSKTDADGMLEKAIRSAWPQSREEPWHYLCESCEDTGWVHEQCSGDASCGRTKQQHLEHAFVRPCWCQKGRALVAKPKQEADELADVGRTSKPMSRLGK